MQFLQTRSGLVFFFAFLILAVTEILKVYFIMPMPGSQWQNNVELAYNINRFIWLSRIVGCALLAASLFFIFKESAAWKKILAVVAFLLVAAVIYLTNFVMLADKMFYQPEIKLMLPTDGNKIEGERIVIGVVLNGEAKAYPVNIIGYHHQVLDTVGGEKLMITYCTVCRTGRVYKPQVNGKPESFRLVGMDQFNAMFEDATTKSWWRQATGECCAGPLKGNKLEEVLSQQMTLASWQSSHPQTLVMQPDPKFTGQYAGLKGYDDGSSRSSLTGTDTTSWQRKSWIVGVECAGGEKIYDWNLLKARKVIHDMVGKTPVVLFIGNDGQSFYVFETPKGEETLLEFTSIDSLHQFTDKNTGSVWNTKGACVEGKLTGVQLKPVAAYQEFYHSFSTFHTKAEVYK